MFNYQSSTKQKWPHFGIIIIIFQSIYKHQSSLKNWFLIFFKGEIKEST